MYYKQYSNREISDLNKTQTWYQKLIEIKSDKKDKKDKKDKNEKYILHATGDANMNGRKYIALPYNCETSNHDIKTKYNLNKFK
jgi:hypothetical protein